MPRQTRSSSRSYPTYATSWTLYLKGRNHLSVAAPGEPYEGHRVLEASTREAIEVAAADYRRDRAASPSLGQRPSGRPSHYSKHGASRARTFRCGHPRTSANSYRHADRTTVCRVCTIARARRWQTKNAERHRLAHAERKRLYRLREHLAALMFHDLMLLVAGEGRLGDVVQTHEREREVA